MKKKRGEAGVLVDLVRGELKPALRLESRSPNDPVRVHHVPAPWQLLGAGNYAAVFAHPSAPELVAKIYAPGRPGIEAECEVYRRLGDHPAYACCLFAEDDFLILTRLRGTTLYDCVHRGLPIPERVIHDIDAALAYARERGLHPNDVHGRNVMMHDGRGLVVDVSDFLKNEDE